MQALDASNLSKRTEQEREEFTEFSSEKKRQCVMLKCFDYRMKYSAKKQVAYQLVEGKKEI